MSSNLFSIFVNGNTIISVTWATVLVGISTPAYPLPTKSPPPGKYALCLLNLLLPHYCLSVTISASVPLFSMLPTSAIHISSDDSMSMLQNFLWNHKEKQNFPILTEKPFKIWSTYTFQHYLLPSLPSPRPHYAHHASLLAIPRTGLACLPRIFVYVLPFACVIPLKTESMDYC